LVFDFRRQPETRNPNQRGNGSILNFLSIKKGHPELAKDLARSSIALAAGPRQIPRPAEVRRIFGMT
jgi:hypothetical protein